MEQLDAVGIHVNHSHIVQNLIKLCKDGGPVWPDKFHDSKETFITMDERTKQHIVLKIKTVEEVDLKKVHDISPADKHVLVYSLETSTHCVFVKRKLKLEKDAYECVNSWGSYDPYPIIEQSQRGNYLYRVRAEWKQALEGYFI